MNLLFMWLMLILKYKYKSFELINEIIKKVKFYFVAIVTYVCIFLVCSFVKQTSMGLQNKVL